MRFLPLRVPAGRLLPGLFYRAEHRRDAAALAGGKAAFAKGAPPGNRARFGTVPGIERSSERGSPLSGALSSRPTGRDAEDDAAPAELNRFQSPRRHT